MTVMPDSGNVIAVEGFPGKWGFGREYRDKEVGDFGRSQTIFLDECDMIEIRYGIGQCSEFNLFPLLKHIDAVSIRNDRDVWRTVRLHDTHRFGARRTSGFLVAALAEKVA